MRQLHLKKFPLEPIPGLVIVMKNSNGFLKSSSGPLQYKSLNGLYKTACLPPITSEKIYPLQKKYFASANSYANLKPSLTVHIPSLIYV